MKLQGFKTKRFDRLELGISYNLRNWALPLSFGTAIWEDTETGDYGTVYSCEYFWALIISVLCFKFRFDWWLQ